MTTENDFAHVCWPPQPYRYLIRTKQLVFSHKKYARRRPFRTPKPQNIHPNSPYENCSHFLENVRFEGSILLDLGGRKMSNKYLKYVPIYRKIHRIWIRHIHNSNLLYKIHQQCQNTFEILKKWEKFETTIKTNTFLLCNMYKLHNSYSVSVLGASFQVFCFLFKIYFKHFQKVGHEIGVFLKDFHHGDNFQWFPHAPMAPRPLKRPKNNDLLLDISSILKKKTENLKIWAKTETD